MTHRLCRKISVIIFNLFTVKLVLRYRLMSPVWQGLRHTLVIKKFKVIIWRGLGYFII